MENNEFILPTDTRTELFQKKLKQAKRLTNSEIKKELNTHLKQQGLVRLRQKVMNVALGSAN